MSQGRQQTRAEEVANSITHGVALLASLLALPILIVVDARRHDPWQIVGGVIFGVSLVLLYAASTVYHALPESRAKEVWRVLDHSAIYLVIAGTYTPFTLGALRGPWGWSLLALVWTLAAAGIVFKSTLGFRFPHLSTGVYLLMGWMGVLAAGPMLAHVDTSGIAWLVAGGLSYTLGVVFFAWEGLLFGHTIWHLFVAAGSTCHFVAVISSAAGIS
ncbi:MAG: hemolysin III family protein [Deltaproteobacteria bacterium]|nr:hemolysin III family protein [Deltaproteobacteria bacterium]